eukprot:TRINITY_DN6427_c0_g1_i2.p1 TRINITY_DN6427_c0_g1~~TRINITY_DN6427_c0_g1_i2.p1  ORF type:complete len:218 (-),score=54.37 TRINITY_DN6427_c0_g1_i2:129-782(-)
MFKDDHNNNNNTVVLTLPKGSRACPHFFSSLYYTMRKTEAKLSQAKLVEWNSIQIASFFELPLVYGSLIPSKHINRFIDDATGKVAKMPSGTHLSFRWNLVQEDEGEEGEDEDGFLGCWDAIPIEQPQLGDFECFEDDLLFNGESEATVSCQETLLSSTSSPSSKEKLYASQLLYLWNERSFSSFHREVASARESPERIGLKTHSRRSIVYQGDIPH